MKFVRVQLLISLTSIFLLMTIFMTLSYTQISVVHKHSVPFGLSSNYIVFQHESRQSVSLDEVIDLENGLNVLLLSRDWKSPLVGIYDPMMLMAFEDGAFGYSYSRYFSAEDYLNGTKSGIVLVDAAQIMQMDKSLYSSDNIEDLMYFSSDQSRFNTEGGVKEIANLGSFKSLGDYLYLDYSELEHADIVIDRLLAHNYQIVEKVVYSGIFDSISMAANMPASLLMLSSFGLYLLFGIACYWHFYDQRREVFVHYFFGATLAHMMKKGLIHFFVVNLLALIPVFLLYLLQVKIGYSVMSMESFFSLYVFHLIMTSLIYAVSLSLVYDQIKKNKKGVIYVR